MNQTTKAVFYRLKQQKAYADIVEQFPYMQLMGLHFYEQEDGKLLFELPFSEHNVGNTLLPSLHGGLIGGYLESAALLHLLWCSDENTIPKMIDFSLDYLRPGRSEILWAQCQTTRQGKRIAQVQIEAWQKNRQKPVSIARTHFLLTE